MAATALGNTVEWYDFSLFGAMATLISQLFFPAGNPALALIYTFGIFGSGFLVRPLGGIIFGHIGDKRGRRTALIWSIGLIAIPVFLMGCLPTAAVIGVWAPILLAALRLIQGLSAGGEFTGSMCFLVEIAPKQRRALYGSLAATGLLCGILLGLGMLALVTTIFSESTLIAWAWRIPFWLGGLFGLAILLLRRRLPETGAFKHEQEEHHLEKIPLFEALHHHFPAILRAFALTALLGVGYYIVMFYMKSYFTLGLGLSTRVGNLVYLGAAGLLLVLTPLSGYLADRIGLKWVMGFGAIGFLAFSWPLVLWQISSDSLLIFVCTQGVIVLFLAFYGGPLMAALVGLFETRYRYSGLALSYNLSQAIFGALAPLVAALLVKDTGNYTGLSWILMAGALIALTGLFTMRRQS